MTPEQSARLTALRAQESRSATEEAEMHYLGALEKEAAEADAKNSANAPTQPAASSSAPTPAPQATVGGSDAEPSLLDRAKALASNKADLVAQNRSLTADNGALRAENARLTAQVGELTKERDALSKERADLQAAIAKAEADAKTVAEKSTDELASLGVQPQSLPAADANASTDAPQTEAELEQAMAGKSFKEQTALRVAFEENRRKAREAKAKAAA